MPTRRRSPEWLAFLCIVMGVLLVPGVCFFSMSDPKLHRYFGLSMLMALVLAIVLLVAGVTMALGAATTARPIPSPSRPLTPRERAASRATGLLIIVLLVLFFIFLIFGR